MPDSIFTKIVKREIPAEIVYEDDICLVFMNIKPNNPGHVLVIPKQQITEWIDLPKDILQRLTDVSQEIGKLLRQVYKPIRVGLAIVGFEVEHVHIHVFPMYKIADIDHLSAKDASPEEIMAEGDKIRTVIEQQGGLKLS